MQAPLMDRTLCFSPLLWKNQNHDIRNICEMTCPYKNAQAHSAERQAFARQQR
jgi:hypothetical protein